MDGHSDPPSGWTEDRRKRPISYSAAETLARTFEMVPESRVSAATTATTITPSTTAYSAIVWPLSSWLSANISVGDSIKGVHLLARRRGAPPTQHRRDLPGGPYPSGVLRPDTTNHPPTRRGACVAPSWACEN